jgi:hypothetical protein
MALIAESTRHGIREMLSPTTAMVGMGLIESRP